MIFSWFKNKKNTHYPDFWIEYLNGFKIKNKLNLQETRFISFDTETTGFDTLNDRILSIGAVSILNKTVAVSDTFETYIKQSVFKKDTVKIHGLLKKGKLHQIEELAALKLFLAYIKNDILVAHHIGFDYKMINEALLRNGLGKLKNRKLDTGTLYKKSKHIIYRDNLKNYSLDDLCEELKIQKIDRHTAIGDALITAIAFQKIVGRLNKKNMLKLKKLFY